MFVRVLSLRSSTKIVALISLASLFFAVANWRAERVHAANVASVQTGDWNNTATWNCGCVPGAADNITISTGTTVKVDTTRHTGDLTVNGTLDTNHQFFEFEGTTFTNNGSIISSTSIDGEIDFNGVGAAAGTTQTIAGTGTYAGSGSFIVDIHIINGTTVTPTSGTVIGGVTPLLIASGSTLSLPNTLVVNNGTTISNSGTISGAGTLQTQGPVTVNSSGTITAPFEAVSGTTTGSGNFRQVTIDLGATLLQNGTITASGNFTVVSGGILNTNQFLEFQGTTFTNNGSIIDTVDTFGEIDFVGVGGAASTTQTIAGTGVYAPAGSNPMEIHIINATTVTPASGTVIGGVRNLLIAAGSTLSLPNTLVFKSGAINNSGMISGAGTLQTQGPVTLNLAGSTTAPFEVVSGTTTGSGNFKQLTIDLGATLLQNGTITANGNFTVVSGGTLNTNQFFEFEGTTFTNNGSIIDTVDTFGEIDFIGIGGAASTTQIITSTGVYAPAGSNPIEIHISNSTIVTPASGAAIGGVRNLSIAAGSTLSLPNTLVFKNGAINNSGAISGAGTLQTQGPVTIVSTGSTTAPFEAVSGTTTGQGTFGRMTIDSGATFIQNGSLTPNGDLTVAGGGTLDMNNQFLFFQGSTFTNGGAIISSSGSGEVQFKGVGGAAGTTQNVAGTGTYNTNGRNDIHLVNSVTVKPASGTVINGVAFFTIDGGATFDFTGSGGITLAGDVSNSGTINLNGGGVACGDATKILIRSNVPGTQRLWSGGGTFSLTDVDVKDQAGSASIAATGGVNSGNNGVNWSFPGCVVPDVSVAVSPASVAEDGATNLVYTFSRTSPTTNALTINFSVSGTATFNTDYTQSGAATFTSSSGTVTFGAGNSTATVTIDPTADSVVEPDETAIFSVTSGTGYNVGSPSAATGTITNDDTDVSVAVSPSSVAEDGATNLVYTFTRTSPTTNALTINFSVSGTATFNTDYTQSGAATFSASSGSVTFGAGNSTATVTIDPTADSVVEPDETVILTVTSGTGYNVGSPSAATGTITNDDATPQTIQFSSAAYPVGEGDKRVDMTITRLGDTSGAASVSFATSDLAGTQNCNVINGAASSRCDYETRLATVKFAAGETSKTVSVFIVDDSYLEGPETFTVNLSNPSGASLGTPFTATVTITDNDLANGANPIDTANSFVRLHYLDFLNREPDTDGFNFWTNQITSCGSDAQCTEVRRINVSASFFLSIEFQQTGFLVERMYKAAYSDADGASTLGGAHTLKVPIIRLSEFLLDTQTIGEGVVVLQPGWEMVLENNKQAFALDFVQRSRFTSAFPTTLTPAQFVDALFANAGVTPSSTDRNAAIGEFGAALNTSDVAARGRALRRVAENSTLTQQEFNRAFVLMQYFGYLRRNPNDFQDTDYTGYDFWLTKLNQFNGNYINAEMVKAFITSIEYRQRFGP